MGSLCIFGHLFREDSTFVFPEEEEAESWEQQNTSDTPTPAPITTDLFDSCDPLDEDASETDEAGDTFLMSKG